MKAGVAARDITPTTSAAMSGFAARGSRSTAIHDLLLVQALVVEDTALVAVDAIGLHEDDCATIRRRCALPEDHVVVHATHTHGGPVSMRGRLGGPVDDRWLSSVIEAAIECVAEAAANQVPVRVKAGIGDDPGVARNRRHPNGPIDPVVPVASLVREDGSHLASVVSYACHPVVLGSDNTALTADYPGVVRRRLMETFDGAPALFLTGCAGDANTGHLASDSISMAYNPRRTFAECERIGTRIATAALSASLKECAGVVTAAAASVPLTLDIPGTDVMQKDVARWRRIKPTLDSAAAALLDTWIAWGENASRENDSWLATVSVLRWGEVLIIALPGEPFATAALTLRNYVKSRAPKLVTFVIGYSNGCPGYFPSNSEYTLGGYEVSDAHRYYGMPGPFIEGSLESLLSVAIGLLDDVL